MKLPCDYCGMPPTSWQLRRGGYAECVSEQPPGTKKVMCGTCVSHGRPRAWREQEIIHSLESGDQVKVPLKEWRKSKKLTQNDLAKVLMVNRVQIAKVEKGGRLMPARWRQIIGKMYPNDTQVPE